MSSEVRALSVLALLIVTAVGVAAVQHAPPTSGVGVHGAGAVVVTLGIVVLLAGAAMMPALLRVVSQTARRQRGDDEMVIVPERHDTFWQRLGALLLAFLVVGFAVGLAIAVAHVHFAAAQHPLSIGARSPASPPTRNPRRASQQGSTGGGLIVLAVVVAVVVLAIGGYLIARALRRVRVERGSEQQPEPRTADALRSAAAALAASVDPRAAILASYRAMEHRLAAAGTARSVADTPEELLDRAARSGLLLPEAAGRLAALFREARFSTHPMTEAHRAEAQSALAAVAQAVGRH